jgi:hypothetical protein
VASTRKLNEVALFWRGYGWVAIGFLYDVFGCRSGILYCWIARRLVELDAPLRNRLAEACLATYGKTQEEQHIVNPVHTVGNNISIENIRNAGTPVQHLLHNRVTVRLWLCWFVVRHRGVERRFRQVILMWRSNCGDRDFRH